MLIQTKPKLPGEPVEAVQFLGDPSVHPSIFHSTDPRPHWRVGRESIGGSSWLDVGDWIVGEGRELKVIHPDQFKQDWQIVESPQDKARSAALDELTAISQELGGYD